MTVQKGFEVVTLAVIVSVCVCICPSIGTGLNQPMVVRKGRKTGDIVLRTTSAVKAGSSNWWDVVKQVIRAARRGLLGFQLGDHRPQTPPDTSGGDADLRRRNKNVHLSVNKRKHHKHPPGKTNNWKRSAPG